MPGPAVVVGSGGVSAAASAYATAIRGSLGRQRLAQEREQSRAAQKLSWAQLAQGKQELGLQRDVHALAERAQRWGMLSDILRNKDFHPQDKLSFLNQPVIQENLKILFGEIGFEFKRLSPETVTGIAASEAKKSGAELEKAIDAYKADAMRRGGREAEVIAGTRERMPSLTTEQAAERAGAIAGATRESPMAEAWRTAITGIAEAPGRGLGAAAAAFGAGTGRWAPQEPEGHTIVNAGGGIIVVLRGDQEVNRIDVSTVPEEKQDDVMRRQLFKQFDEEDPVIPTAKPRTRKRFWADWARKDTSPKWSEATPAERGAYVNQITEGYKGEVTDEIVAAALKRKTGKSKREEFASAEEYERAVMEVVESLTKAGYKLPRRR